jgi:ParB family chromosome partitioning protein
MARRIIAMRLGKDRISGRTSLTKRTLSAGLLIEEYEQHVQHQPSAVARLSAVTHRLMILSTSMKRLLSLLNVDEGDPATQLRQTKARG